MHFLLFLVKLVMKKISLIQPLQKNSLTMEPYLPQQVLKTVLRNLEQTEPRFYLIPFQVKVQLGYPEKCLKSPQNKEKLSELISIDCQMIMTQKGQEVCRIVIVNQKKDVVFNQWYLTQRPVIDYLTHITGITQGILAKNAKRVYKEEQKKKIMQIAKEKIICGHDLTNDLKVLDIEHSAFIDTVHIYPHHFGLPLKNKLKDLAMDLLRKPIQWGSHNPAEDAITALEIIQNHLKHGKGTVDQVKMKMKNPQDYKDVWQIIHQAQLQKDKIVGFFLRGSRALGLQIEVEGYRSDWDYVCIYKTKAIINGRLIKLPEIDITIFDYSTFQQLIDNENDLSYLELFYFPKQHQIINNLKLPQIRIQALRQSLGFHLSKAKMKIQRFKKDPTKQWKILKAVHMKIRFMDNFLQFLQFGQIKDVKRMNPTWEKFKQTFEQNKNFEQSLKTCERYADKLMAEVRQKYQSVRKVRNLDQTYPETKIIKQKKIKPIINKNEEKMIMESKQQNVNFKEERNFGRLLNSCKMQIISQSSMNVQKSNPNHQQLHIVRELRQHGFQNIEAYKITMKRGVKYQNLIQFKYLQSASFKNPICQQARGIILDEDRFFEVVAFPYTKFHDYNDQTYSKVKQFDFLNYRIYEKFDGSLAFIYFYKDEWHVASSSVPDGQSNYCFARKETTTQFRKQFWRIFNQLNYQLPHKQDENKTFVFELMSINHIIVVNRQKSQLILHGVRNIDTLREQDHLQYGKKYNWSVSQPVNLEIKNVQNPLPEIVEITQKLNPLKQEGFVLCDCKYNRLKVRNSNYLRINWLGQLNLTKNKNPSRYVLINIVLAGQGQNFAKYCPQWQPIVKNFCQKIQKLNNLVLQIFEPLKDLEKKQFAKEVHKKDKNIQNFLFILKSHYNLYQGRIQHSMHPKKFYQLLDAFHFNDQ